MIRVCLIHNRETERLVSILPSITKITQALDDLSLPTHTSQLSHQEEFTPDPLLIFLSQAFLRSLLYHSLCIRYQRPYQRLKSLLALPYKLISDFGLAISHRRSVNLTIYKERSLTCKYYTALSQFLSVPSHDFLLLLESDALLQSPEDVACFLQYLVKHYSKSSTSLSCFVGEGFGTTPNTYPVLRKTPIDFCVSKDRSLGFDLFHPAASDTTVSTIINRQMAHDLHNLLKFPPLRNLPIDQLFNLTFFCYPDTRNECMHARTPLFRHGSAIGEFLSKDFIN